MKERIALALAALFLALLPATVLRASVSADLCLVLVQDTSSSLDDAELDQMRAGLANALTDPRLSSAFAAARVQVMVVAYGERAQVSIPWFAANPTTLASAATAILDMPRAPVGGTHTGDAIAFALAQLAGRPCIRQVVDVATDGETNGGRAPHAVTADLDPFAVQVNGLVIGKPADVVRFQETTQFGFGAFTVHVGTYDDFGIAMMRKLNREISMNTGGNRAL